MNDKTCTRSMRRQNIKRKNRKEKKQEEQLNSILITDERKRLGKKFNRTFLKNCVVGFDGGLHSATAPQDNPVVSSWSCQPLVDGHLDLCLAPSTDKGLIC